MVYWIGANQGKVLTLALSGRRRIAISEPLGQTVGSDQIGVLPRELIGVDYTTAVRDDCHLV